MNQTLFDKLSRWLLLAAGVFPAQGALAATYNASNLPVTPRLSASHALQYHRTGAFR